MGMISFSVLFPDVAKREVRVAHVRRELEAGEPGASLPVGSYAFKEFYCVDPRCDCRRVMLYVQNAETGQVLAAISYGFDRDEPEAGPFLDPTNEQSEHARELLDLAKKVVLADLDYTTRLERHYQLVKAAISDPAHPIHGRIPAPRSEGEEAFEAIKAMALTSTKIGRNDPCYCESGKKYKRCCLLAPTTSWAV